jgi:hypothetical protein
LAEKGEHAELLWPPDAIVIDGVEIHRCDFPTAG